MHRPPISLLTQLCWCFLYHKKLSCRRETARRFVSLNILLCHLRSLKVIRSDTVAYVVYESLLVFQWHYVCMSYRFWDIQRQSMAWPWNCGVGVVQDHWKWRRSIDHNKKYDFLLVGYCKYSCVFYHFQLIWRWIIVTIKKWQKVIQPGTIRQLECGFLFTFHSNYGRVFSRLWDI